MEQYDKIIFDFDDTIWSRDPKDIDCSIYNIKFIKENLGDKAIIISGNSYNSIESKLEAVDISMPHIWADANSILYENLTERNEFKKVPDFNSNYFTKNPRLFKIKKNKYMSLLPIKKLENNKENVNNNINQKNKKRST